MTKLRLFCVPRPRCCNGFFDECLKYLHVHIRELLDVQASLTGGVLTELGEQRLGAIKAYRAVQNVGGLARRKANDEHIAFAPALVGIVVGVEPDDRRPHMLGSLPVTFCISLVRALASARLASSLHASRNAGTLMVVGLVLFSAMNLPLGPTSEAYGTNSISSPRFSEVL